MPKNSQPSHYPGIPQEITPQKAAKLLKQRPGAMAVINERVHNWRMAHDPEYNPQPEETEVSIEGQRPRRAPR